MSSASLCAMPWSRDERTCGVRAVDGNDYAEATTKKYLTWHICIASSCPLLFRFDLAHHGPALASDSRALPGETSTVSHQRVAFAALQHRDFRWFFVTTMLAMMADNIEHVVSYWLLFQKFHSPVLAGFADISHWTPFLLLSVYFGGIADRYDCRKIIQAAQIMYMAVSAAWAVLFYTDTIQIWHACVLLVIHGIAGVLWTPAEQLVIHDIVGAEHIQSAVRLNATSRQLGILFGPAVGAGLMLLLGPSLGLLANAAIYLPLTVWLLFVPYTGHLREGALPKRALAWNDIFSVIQEVI